MKKFILILSFVSVIYSVTCQNTESGLIIPYIDTINIVNPKNGMMVCDSATNSIYIFEASRWGKLSAKSESPVRFKSYKFNGKPENELLEEIFGNMDYPYIFILQKSNQKSKVYWGVYVPGSGFYIENLFN